MPETTRRSPQQARARATRDAILVAAAHVLKTDGADALTTNKIADVAGVSIGSLYQYFPNKASIVDALRARHHGWFEEALDDEIGRGEQGALRPGIRAAIERLVAMHRVDPALGRALASPERPLDPEQLETFRERMREYLRAHPDALRPIDPELATYLVTRTLETLIYATAREEPERFEHPAFAVEVTELVARYLER